MTTREAYDRIMESEVFRNDGPKIQLSEALIELGNCIKAEDETDWNMGEGNEATLDSLVVGAYWSLSEWHGGQASEEYAALSSLGSIFSPGMSSPPDEEDSEYSAYELIGKHFEAGKH